MIKENYVENYTVVKKVNINKKSFVDIHDTVQILVNKLFQRSVATMNMLYLYERV
jgi:NRPS condensation-like uncharacterized protein